MNIETFYQTKNDTAKDYPRSQSLHELIALTCSEFANEIAATSEGRSLTYRELDQAANQLANHLIRLGVKKGDLVGVCCNRDADIPVLLNGIMRAGAGYVPLDPDYPVERLQYMVENAELDLVVAHEKQRTLVGSFECQTVFYDTDMVQIQSASETMPEIEIDSESDTAYVIYTSGSTGKPKGVMVPHQAVVNLLLAFKNQIGFGADDKILATTTLSFDISVPEIFMPLVCGAQTVIVDRETAKDQVRLVEAIEKNGISVVQATPSHWRIICDSEFKGGKHLKFIIGGEKLPRDLINPLLDRCGELWNGYGPTEGTVYSAVEQVENSSDRILVGLPLPNTTAYIVNESKELCAPETEGELWIGGDCVTLGYLKREELTAEKFVDFRGERVYRTGDLAKILDDGKIEILGRIDNQVKIHGHRIELGEIDSALAADDSVRLAAAVVREDQPGDVRLVGYVLPHENKTVDVYVLKKQLEQTLPEYMVPSVITVVDEFPYTPSGKTDRKAFPAPSTARPDLGVEYVAPANADEITLANIWQEVLQFDRIGANDNFFELGGNSIKALKAVKRGNRELGSNVSNAEFFDNPTIRMFVEAACRKNKQTKTGFEPMPRRNAGTGQFAVVGMAAKMPGAQNVREFWKNLCESKETIRFFDDSELDASLPSIQINDPAYVKARGIVDEADFLDAKFFNMPPREAELVDPQQRLMLELSWTALEDAGCVPGKFDGSIGVWAGTYETGYFQKNVLSNPEAVERNGEFQLGVYNEKDYIATRVAHKLNLNGPAINVNTACSTSLVAIIEACTSLNAGMCDAAIAGGVSIHFPQNSGHLHQEGSIFSPDGHCRPFDADSGGTLFSDGAGVVVLKRLEDAIESNDHIYAVVKGFGINNDGGKKASFSAPSIDGQASAVAMAHQTAGINADSISYVEAHGTATPIGDPIEVAALSRVFDGATDDRQFCAIGSVKSNIGHTVAAAGIAGFIKTALALQHEKIPATLHFNKPNPQIDFESSPFFVCDELKPWPRTQTPRRAGVSSFGVGGTNAHIVLEEAPTHSPEPNDTSSNWLIPVSAKSENALEQNVQALADELTHSEYNFSDVAKTLISGRDEFPFRGFVVANSTEEACEKLSKGRAPGFVSRKSSNRKVVMMFPGQGSQYVRMGQNLYNELPVFKATLDKCCDILKPLLECDLRDILFPVDGDEERAQEILRSTQFTQPAIFSIGYALAKTMLSLGVQPAAMIGHSIGEFVAACIAGVFSLEDGLMLITKRGELMQELPGGSMMSVRKSGAYIEPLITGKMAVASYNGPELCVVAGPKNEVADLQKQLEADGVICKHLHTSHAFHSPMMDSIVDPYAKVVSRIELSSPEIAILSTVTGTWMTTEEATDPSYWADHLRQPVRFSDAIEKLWDDDPMLVPLELGPRKTLATLAMQHAADKKNQFAVPTMGSNTDNNAEWKNFLSAVGQLWTLGVEFDLEQVAPENGRRVPLPTYAFQRKRFFIEPTVNRNEPPLANTAEAIPALTSLSIPSNTEKKQQPITGNFPMSRLNNIIAAVNNVFEDSSGFDLADFDAETTFFEMGLDSLVLTQTATALKREFEVNVTFRQLLEETPNVISLAEFLDAELPADRYAVVETPAAVPVAVQPVVQPVSNEMPAVRSPQPVQNVVELPAETNANSVNPTASAPTFNFQSVSGSLAESVINNQLQVMAAQLQLLGGGAVNTAPVAPANASAANNRAVPTEAQDENSVQSNSTVQPACQSKTNVSNVTEKKSSNGTASNTPTKKAFGAAARVNLNSDELNEVQQAKLDQIIQATEKMMPGSKAYAQQHRKYMADPRTVSGFKPNMKEMTHPIVVEKSKGAILFDVDGNEYIDYTCGFGSNFLGHSTDLIIDAIREQLPSDFSIGPQSPLAGEVAKLFCELTGADRMAFSNTGSEAVLGCTRLARTYTGKQKIVMFTGDYHGILDEVIVRGNKNLKSFPAATGIPREHVDNTVILEYGSEEALQYIRENLDELAAVVVETVQSRKPELQPREFLQKLRDITENVDTALIFDEVITGFRIAPGGAQEHFGIRADLASYGKVVGGGMPIGLIGGRAEYMDGLDGGFWQYGDDSRPEAGMTYFAGTFVRHPLTLAASKAILEHIKTGGQSMYDRLNALSDNMAEQLNEMFKELDVPMFLANFGSLFKVQFEQELPYSELVFASLRLKGFFIWDHRPCLLNLAHTQEHVDAFVIAFRETIVDLQRAGFVPGDGYKKFAEFDPNKQPCEGARVGKDKNGNPGWFMADATNPGQFIQVNQTF